MGPCQGSVRGFLGVASFRFATARMVRAYDEWKHHCQFDVSATPRNPGAHAHNNHWRTPCAGTDTDRGRMHWSRLAGRIMPIRMPGSLAPATCWSITSFERGPRQLQLMIDFAQVVITGGVDDVQASLRNSSIRTLRRGRTSERRGPERSVGQPVFPLRRPPSSPWR